MRVIHPEGWAPSKGYSNGILAEGRVLALAGQVGWNAEQVFERDDFAGQFDQVLSNICAVLEAAGGRPEHVIKMTCFVTDLPAYHASVRALGDIWKRHFGRHYPAMTLVGVAGLVDEGALLEIESWALLPSE